MSNANRDYAIVYDVKNGLIVLSRPLIFYITDKNTSNIFVKLVTRVNVGNGIDQYTNIENASNYVLTMRVIKPNNEVKSLEATQHEEESIFQFDLTEDFKDIPSKYICELTISTIVSSRQELITSDPFSYEVKRSILSSVSEIIETEDTTVEKLLNDLEATKAEISSQVKERATQNELALERARIDNLTTLSEGSTTGDAELIDGRIGADGNTYSNIGSAIRTQFTDIKNNINTITTTSINLFDYNKISCKNFHNELNAFQEQTDANWVLSDYIAVKQNDIFRAKFPNIATYSAYVVELGSKSESDILRYTKLRDWCNTCEITITNSDTKYVKLSIGVFNDSNWKNIVMITVNNAIPSAFVPYGKRLKDEFKVETLKNEFENYINAGTGYKYFVPNNLYLIKNRNGTRRLMLENMVVAHNLNSFYLSNNTGLLWNQAENYKLINDADSRQQGDYVELYIKTTDKKVKTFEYSIKCVGSDFVTNPASQKNVLMIGDSFTDQGYLPCEVKNILINDLGLTNINFIGRKTDTDINSNVTCLNEGNGGITLLDYIKTDNTEGRGTDWSNPFLFNGSVSYTQYMSNNNFSGDLDIVVIECGVNDILVYGSDESTLSARLKTMIDTIHTEYPNCKIFVVGQKYASDVTDYIDAYKWNNKIMDMNLAYQNLCESDDYKSFCYYVDCGLTFDKLYGSKYEKKLLYKGSEEQVIKVTDWLHPNIMGYYQIAENIASAIAYNCFKS